MAARKGADHGLTRSDPRAPIGARGFVLLASLLGMAIAILLASAIAPVRAQSGIFSIFRPPEPPPSPYADAEDDHAAWVATGAPLMVRPTDDMLKRAPQPSTLPLPPRRSEVLAGLAPPAAPPAPASPPAATTPATPPAASAPAAPSEPEPAAPPPEDEPPSSGDAPQMRQHAALAPSFRTPLPTLAPPAVPEKVTPEELEQEERATPEPAYVEKQTDYVNIRCLKPELMTIIDRAGKHFKGTPVITSGQRGSGRRGSYHRRCMAADFFIAGVERSTLASWLRRQRDAGGVGTYCHTKSVHIDIGDPRNWWQCGRRFSFALRG